MIIQYMQPTISIGQIRPNNSPTTVLSKPTPSRIERYIENVNPIASAIAKYV